MSANAGDHAGAFDGINMDLSDVRKLVGQQEEADLEAMQQEDNAAEAEDPNEGGNDDEDDDEEDETEADRAVRKDLSCERVSGSQEEFVCQSLLVSQCSA